jgi:site-specific recombinase XerD
MTAPTKRERRGWGTGRIFKRQRSRFWYIRWYDATGKRRTEATGTTKRSEAEARLRQRLGEKERGENPDARRVTFEDLEKLLLDDRRARGRRSAPKLKHLKATFAGRRARAITALAVAAYERARLDAGAARATVNNELAALRRAFNLAVEAKLLAPTQVPKIRTPDPRNARQGFFEPVDFAAVLAELPEDLRPVMRFGYLTGWRVRSEVLPLQWRQVDFNAGIVRLEPNTTKNDEGRVFPFDALPELAALLREQRERTTAVERRTGAIVRWVFHRDGEPIWSYRTAWENAVERAAHDARNGLRVLVRPQLVGRIVHDLRRTAVRNLERAGVPRSVAMKLTGHKTESVYRRYAIVAEADLRDGVAKLATHTSRAALA